MTRSNYQNLSDKLSAVDITFFLSTDDPFIGFTTVFNNLVFKTSIVVFITKDVFTKY